VRLASRAASSAMLLRSDLVAWPRSRQNGESG
jgi:hypothetical protein